MDTRSRRRFVSASARYGLAIAAVAAATLLTTLLHERGVRGVLFIPAILVSSWYGGIGPGLLAAGLSVFSLQFFFIAPRFSLRAFAVSDATYVGVFSMAAVMVAWLTGAQRHAEDELRRQANLLDLSHDAVFVRDQHDVITYWNQAAAERYGWTREEALGKASHQLLRTEFPAPLAEIEAELLRAGRWDGELVHTKADGTPVTVASRWSLQRDERGRPVVLETNNDITARRQVEQALRDSEEQWRDVFENNPTMYFIVGADGTVLSVNSFGAQQLGYAVEDLVGRPVLSVFHESDREAVGANVRLCLEQLGQPHSWEARKVRRDGREIAVRETAKAVSRATGVIVLVACEDVTEQKRAAEALRESQAELARVSRLTMLGEITASMAHEINQPLAAAVMNGNACRRWLEAEPPNLEEAREAARRVVSDGERAGQVVARVRSLVRRDAPPRETLDIDEVIEETLAFTRVELEQRRVSVRTELCGHLPPVAGDRIQLQQVLVNLILNGIDSMSGVGDGARVLTVNSRVSDANTVAVAVTDNGRGVDPAHAERIFEAFFSTKSTGLGMGLSVSRSIVEQHGGRIWATPNDGQGLTMQFVLPAGGA
jgi:PAS domain S-box-containing protein